MCTSAWNGIRPGDTSGQDSDHSVEQMSFFWQIDLKEKYQEKGGNKIHYFSFSEQIAFKIDQRSTWKAIGGDNGDHFSDLQQNMQRC